MKQLLYIAKIIVSINFLTSNNNEKPPKVKNLLKKKNHEKLKKELMKREFISKNWVCQNQWDSKTDEQWRRDAIKGGGGGPLQQLDRNYQSSMVPTLMWLAKDTDYAEKLRDWKKKDDQLTIALQPQIAKCRDGFMEQRPIQCDCEQDPHNNNSSRHYKKKMDKCISQKAEFTAGLLMTRIFCGSLNIFASEGYQKMINDDYSEFKRDGVQNHLVTWADTMNLVVIARSLVEKCRLQVKDKGEQLNLKLKQQIQNWCQDTVQQCQNLTLENNNPEDSRVSQITANCEITDKKLQGKYQLFELIEEKTFKKALVKNSGSVIVFSCLVTGLLLPHVAVGVVAVKAALGAASLFVGTATVATTKVMEVEINQLKGKETILFTSDVLWQLVGLALKTQVLSDGIDALYKGIKIVKQFYGQAKMSATVRDHDRKGKSDIHNEREEEQVHQLQNCMLSVVGAIVEALNKDKQVDNYILDNQMVHQLGIHNDGTNDEERVGFGSVLTELHKTRAPTPAAAEGYGKKEPELIQEEIDEAPTTEPAGPGEKVQQ